MNVLSLFDGMACGRIALERAGLPVTNYYASEIDGSAMKVAKYNWPEIQHIGDVTKVRLPKDHHIDLLIGGSPCQGFSYAGGLLNFNDPRSALFFEYVRLLKECRRYNPDVKFLLENVRMKPEFEAVITDSLGVEPVMINSKLVSAQDRKRVYWTNISFEVPKDRGVVLQDILETGEAHRLKSKCLRIGGVGSKPGDKHEWDIADKSNRRYTVTELERLQTVPDGYCSIATKREAYKMLGNGWTVDVITHIFKQITLPCASQKAA